MKKLNTAQRLSPCGDVKTPSLNITAPHTLIYVEHFVRLVCLYVPPRGQRMKAVLEYTYPQDESKLKHALRGEEYYLALVEIDRVMSMGDYPEQLLNRIADLVAKGLAE